MSLQRCLTDLKEALAPFDVSSIEARAQELQGQGLPPRDAEVQAVQERLESLRTTYRDTYSESIRELSQENVPADLELQMLLDSLPDSEVELLDAEADVIADEGSTDEQLDAAVASAGNKVVERAKSEYGYPGTLPPEAAEWIRAYRKFGPEGMTTAARMARAREMGFNVENPYYHGSPHYGVRPGRSISAFDPTDYISGASFFFVSPDPESASGFAGEVDLDTRPTVYKVLVRDKGVLRLSEFKEGSVVYGRFRDKLHSLLTDAIPEENQSKGTHPAVESKLAAMASGDWTIIETDRYVQAAITELGYTGFTVAEHGDPSRGFEDPNAVENTALYDPSDVRSVNAAFDPDRAASPTLLAQAKRNTKKGSITLTPDNQRIIRLTQASDLSTFMHEAAHLILEAEKQFAEEYGLGQNQKAILKMLGINSFNSVTRREHELFARTFEDYLRTGKSPSATLSDAFAAFARWLTNIYRSIKQLGLPLNEETVEVFDRLLATQTEIAQFKSNVNYDAFFTSKEAAGMSESEWKSYQEGVEKRNNRSESTLFEKLVSELAKRRTKEWNEERKPIIEERMAALKKTPVYRAEAIAKKNKFDPGLVREALGVDTLPPNVLYVVKKGGVDPEIVATETGFDSVQDMLEQIRRSPTLKDAATAEAQKIMISKYGDMLNDGSIEAEARSAMHNEAQAELLLKEIRALGRTARKPTVDQQYLKAKAKEMVADMTFSELRPMKYYRAEVRAAQKAATAKTPAEQYKFKVQQLANHHLFIQSTAARKDAMRYRDYGRGVTSRSYRGSQVDPEYINWMKQLAKAYDMSSNQTQERRTQRALAFLQWLRGQESAGASLMDMSLIRLATNQTTVLPSFDELTLSELRSMYDQLRHLRYVGGKMADEAKQQFVEERARLIETAQQNRTQKSTDKFVSDRGKSRAAGMQHMVNLLPSLRNLIRKMDNDPGQEGGAFFDSIYRRISASESRKLSLSDDFYGKFDELFDGSDITSVNDSPRTARTVIREDGSKWTLSARQRFMLAAYWGTESSRQAIRDGDKVTDAEVEQMLSHLTKDQLQMVKNVWALSDHMKSPLFAAAVERDGVAPEELTPTPFVVNGVSLPGGHMRLFYGDSTADLEEKIRLDDDPLSSFNAVVPSRAGSLIERVGSGGKKVLLDTSNIFRNVEENIHYIAYAKTASDLQIVFNNKDVRAAISENFGSGFDRALLQNIQSLTTNHKEREGIPQVAAIIRQMRYAKSMMYLAYNLKNLVQQVVPLYYAMRDVGPINYISSFSAAMGNWAETKAFVESKSAEMKGRKAHLNREHADVAKAVRSGSRAETAMNTFAKHGFTLHVIIDSIIAYPTWMHAYNTGMESHGDEQKAIIDANVGVAQSVGSGMDLHVGKVLRSSENSYVRMLTVFGSWFNSSPFQRMYMGTMGGKKFLAPAAFEALVVAPLLVMAMSELLVANIPKGADEDDPWWKWLALGYFQFIGASIPVVGELLPGQNSFKPSTLLDDALYVAAEFPGEVTSFAQGDKSAIFMMEQSLKVFGSFVALPGSGNVIRALDFAQAVDEGDEEFNMIDSYRAVVEGSDKNPR